MKSVRKVWMTKFLSIGLGLVWLLGMSGAVQANEGHKARFEKARTFWIQRASDGGGRSGGPSQEPPAFASPSPSVACAVSTPSVSSEGVSFNQTERDFVDLTHLPFYTMDSRKTKVMDDAVAVEELPDGAFQLHIAVVDPTALVQLGSPEDRSAIRKIRTRRGRPFSRKRAEQISMNPGVERRAVVLSCVVTPEGEMRTAPTLRRAKMSSQGRIHNKEATAFLRQRQDRLVAHGGGDGDVNVDVDVDVGDCIQSIHKAARALNRCMGMRCRKSSAYSAEVIVQKYMMFFNRYMGQKMAERIRAGWGGVLKAQTTRNEASFYTAEPIEHLSLGSHYISSSNGARTAVSWVALSLLLAEETGERWDFIKQTLGDADMDDEGHGRRPLQKRIAEKTAGTGESRGAYGETT